jgi:translin
MENVYEAVVCVDYPDAVTGGLRRSADALRAVLERTRSDVTTTVLQVRLQAALERRPGDDANQGSGDSALPL